MTKRRTGKPRSGSSDSRPPYLLKAEPAAELRLDLSGPHGGARAGESAQKPRKPSSKKARQRQMRQLEEDIRARPRETGPRVVERLRTLVDDLLGMATRGATSDEWNDAYDEFCHAVTNAGYPHLELWCELGLLSPTAAKQLMDFADRQFDIFLAGAPSVFMPGWAEIRDSLNTLRLELQIHRAPPTGHPMQQINQSSMDDSERGKKTKKRQVGDRDATKEVRIPGDPEKECARSYVQARRRGEKLPLKQIVADYTEKSGDSASSILKCLSQHPNLWKEHPDVLKMRQRADNPA